MPMTIAASWTARVLARVMTSEGMLGVSGCAIACASGSFALYMNMHSPHAQQPSSTYFTVFAQLGSKGRIERGIVPIGTPVASLAGDLDPVVTGSISRRSRSAADGDRPILTDMLLRQIDGDTALVEVNDSLAVYKIGDLIPGAGRLVAMTREGGRPALETSRGLIVESH